MTRRQASPFCLRQLQVCAHPSSVLGLLHISAVIGISQASGNETTLWIPQHFCFQFLQWGGDSSVVRVLD